MLLAAPRQEAVDRFLLVTNLKAKDGGKTIVAGNEKVIAARLSDAKFFWEKDLKKTLEVMRDELKGITFHEKLGTQFERAERVKELARQIATSQELCEAALAQRAGAGQGRPRLRHGRRVPRAAGPDGPLLCRSRAHEAGDRPRHRAALQAEGPDRFGAAGEEGDGAAVAVALADKLDMLVGFWAIGEKPTGSGDPYQLRRAALGVIRLVIDNDLRMPLILS